MKPNDNSYDDLLRTTTVSDDLDRDLRDLPRQTAHWGWLAAEAHQASLSAKADKDHQYATVYARLKAVKGATGRSEGLTEAALEAKVELDPEYRHYVAKWIEAEGNAKRLQAAVMALQVKNSSLMQLGANERQSQKVNDSVSSARR